jgi:anthranilate synthase component 1
MRFFIKTIRRTSLADTTTPVNLYLKLRDRFPGAVMLESSDYRANHNSISYLALSPAAEIIITAGIAVCRFPDGSEVRTGLTQPGDTAAVLQSFSSSFEWEPSASDARLFGYVSYDAVPLFEKIEFHKTSNLPLIRYAVFRFIIEINHFTNTLTVFENRIEKDIRSDVSLPELDRLIRNETFPSYRFQQTSNESANMTDDDFLALVQRGITHCRRGDVFQVVLSRHFSTAFKGDEFNVYRALRSVNPSPYLFYFDYGGYRLFGSSPESQLVIRDGQASIRPIAGTFRRNGRDESDSELAQRLLTDDKENAEHVMLVDLARNDLSRHGTGVTVETFREIQFYSHVVHLVSNVSARVRPDANLWEIVGDCFPAGTLSGAPKYRAMQLIDAYEPTPRSFYGGCIGFLGPDSFNHAIMIRSFLSHRNVLTYQAGAGIVAASEPEKERQEVDTKLAALRQALDIAEEL